MSDKEQLHLSIRYGSLFTWGRPPLPAKVADQLAQLTCDLNIKTVLAVGVTSSTALTALGFGDPCRKIHVICPRGEWGAELAFDPDDFPELPTYDPYLPVDIIVTSDVPTRKHFDLVYIDNDEPFGVGEFEPERLARVILRAWSADVVVLGFCQGFSSPVRLRAELERLGFNFSEISGNSVNRETREAVTQMLAYAKCPS